jgi:hypothetical protein
MGICHRPRAPAWRYAARPPIECAVPLIHGAVALNHEEDLPPHLPCSGGALNLNEGGGCRCPNQDNAQAVIARAAGIVHR